MGCRPYLLRVAAVDIGRREGETGGQRFGERNKPLTIPPHSLRSHYRPGVASAHYRGAPANTQQPCGLVTFLIRTQSVELRLRFIDHNQNLRSALQAASVHRMKLESTVVLTEDARGGWRSPPAHIVSSLIVPAFLPPSLAIVPASPPI